MCLKSNIMNNQEAYQQAKNRIQKKLAFRIHLAIYVGVNLLLLLINLSTSPDNLWVKWPILGWGIGIVFHGLNAYVFPGASTITDEMIRKEMEKSGKT